MSEQKQELTYILGAGASYQSIPVVKTFAERFNDFYEFLNLFTKPQHSFFIDDEITRNEINSIKIQIKIVYEEFKNHQSFDTYFKKLFHTKNTESIAFTKRILNYYFLWEHSKDSTFVMQRGDWTTTLTNNIDPKYFNKQSQIDKRYDALIAGLLQPNENLEMFCKTNFISWNYDINLLASLKNYFSPETTFDEFLKEIESPQNTSIWEIKSAGITIINMNGFFYSDLYGKKKSLNDLAIKDSFVESNSYLTGILDKSDHLKIKFAWEDDNNIYQFVKQTIDNSENIVVIGYTFPLYNRLVDKTYFSFDFLNKNSKVSMYIQDPSAKKNKTAFMNNFNISRGLENRIFEIEDCDSFFVPSNIHNRKHQATYDITSIPW